METIVGSSREQGSSLLEVVIALSLTLLVTTSAFLFLQSGQTALAREPEVAEMNANVRSALARLSADLTVAGVGTPSEMAVLWHDGLGSEPDEITILYADSETPIARPQPCAGDCDSIGSSSSLTLDPWSLSPAPVDYESTYPPGMTLFALSSALVGPECSGARPALVSFEVTEAARCAGPSGGSNGAEGCGALVLSHGSVRATLGTRLPEGFESEVNRACAFVGAFHVIQYRLSAGELERRDLFQGEDWSPVAANIGDFQIQYMQGFEGQFLDAPSEFPSAFNPTTWLTAVRFTIAGAGDDESPLRRSLSTTVSLRNQLGQASMTPTETAAVGWN